MPRGRIPSPWLRRQNQTWYVTLDGKQFLLNGSVSLEGEAPLTLVTNWAAELKK